MRKTMNIDFGRLLGFEMVSVEMAGRLDLQDETFGDKLGAEVGLEPGRAGPTLFQDETLADKLGAKVGVEDAGIALFQDDTVAAKLGAKMGPGDGVEPVSPIEPSKPR